MSVHKRVAVIGAGPAGLVALKSLLEDGHDATAFESSPVIGGLWNYDAFRNDLGYQEVDHYDQPIQGVYESLRMNTSKEVTAFSDYPAKESASPFLTHLEYLDYMTSYADHFNLNGKIRLNSRVTQLQKENNGWQVTYQGKEGSSNTEKFEFVVIASGCFKFPKLPKLKGISQNYKGVALHSSQVRDAAIFNNKRVLIVGCGYSGCEIAVGALQNKVTKLFLCFSDEPEKKNYWAMDRFVQDEQGRSVPWDHVVNRHDYFDHYDRCQSIMRSWYTLLQSKDGHGNMRYPGDSVSLTDIKILTSSLESKKSEVVGPIDHLEGKNVVFKDGRKLSNIDFVVMGTGYLQRYPFIDDIWKPQDQIKCELYRYMIHPEKRMDGLAFICSTPSPMPLFHIMEMQSRWICSKLITRNYDAEGNIFTDTERENMRDNIKITRSNQPADLSYNYLVDNPGYSANLAKEIRCFPPTYDELKEGTEADKRLAVALYYGPVLMGTQYRIQGPHSWAGAKEWIIQVAEKAMSSAKFEDYVNSL